MVFDIKFDSIAELATFQQLALQADKPVYIANEDDTIRVDPRSFLGLFTLDFSKPLKWSPIPVRDAPPGNPAARAGKHHCFDPLNFKRTGTRGHPMEGPLSHVRRRSVPAEQKEDPRPACAGRGSSFL